MKKFLVLAALAPPGLFVGSFLYYTLKTALEDISDLKAKSGVAEIHYRVLADAAPKAVRDQILNDLKFKLILLEE